MKISGAIVAGVALVTCLGTASAAAADPDRSAAGDDAPGAAAGDQFPAALPLRPVVDRQLQRQQRPHLVRDRLQPGQHARTPTSATPWSPPPRARWSSRPTRARPTASATWSRSTTAAAGTTFYAHLNSRARSAPGTTVSQGQKIGTVGNTSKPGNSISPHLHFEVRTGQQLPGEHPEGRLQRRHVRLPEPDADLQELRRQQRRQPEHRRVGLRQRLQGDRLGRPGLGGQGLPALQQGQRQQLRGHDQADLARQGHRHQRLPGGQGEDAGSPTRATSPTTPVR